MRSSGEIGVLVETERLAQVLETTPDRVTSLAESMGLPPNVPVAPQMLERGYITLIRRNWHLLPYDQLTQLLEMTAEELAFVLREDDFLYVKLGAFKPKCEPVKYSEPSAEAQSRAAEIKQIVNQFFADKLVKEHKPPFAFVSDLSQPISVRPEATDVPSQDSSAPRFVYSYFALFGDPLSTPELDPYPDGLLARLREHGVNGVWMHVVLRQLAPGGEHFPEWGKGHEQRLANLKKLVERARRYGIDIYLYMNEPRAMPKSFFENRPEMAGVWHDGHATVCTSDPRVRQWLTDSLAYVFREVPELGGIFTITASENLTNCASHGLREQCPRCKSRSDAEIIVEVNAAMEAGVHRSAPDAKVIVWDWGWKGHSISGAPDIIEQLPQSTWLMSVSEWSLPVERGGVQTEVNEYAMSAVGPGPRATRQWQYAKSRGLKTVAKVQFNVTWELTSVPYLPVMNLVAEHCSNLASVNTDGLMLSWSLGGYPSPNLELAHHFSKNPSAKASDVLQAVAERHFGEQAAPHVLKAWTKFSDAFREFPYHAMVLYYGPQHMGPANLLHGQPTGYRSTMVGLPYDDLERWCGPYPPEILASQFAKVANGWAEGLADLTAAQPLVPEALRGEAAADLSVAQAARLHFTSSSNQARFIMLRNTLANTSDASQRQQLRESLKDLLVLEQELAVEMFDLATNDSRLGYEASNHYFFLPIDLVEKVVNCVHLKSTLD